MYWNHRAIWYLPCRRLENVSRFTSREPGAQRVEVLSTAPAGKGPIWSRSSALLTFRSGPACPRSSENTRVRSHRHNRLAQTRACAHTQSGEYARSVPLFSPFRSASWRTVPGFCQAVDGSLRWSVLIAGGLKQWLLGLHHNPRGIWVHCDKGRETCGLPTNRYPTRVPPRTSTWLLLGRTSGLRLCRPQSWRQKPWE